MPQHFHYRTEIVLIIVKSIINIITLKRKGLNLKGLYICIFAFSGLTILIFSGNNFARVHPVQKDSSLIKVSSEENTNSLITIDNTNKQIRNKLYPVMGNEIDSEFNTVEYKDKLYGFCCNGCDKKFRKNP